jgi:hypothetical protein
MLLYSTARSQTPNHHHQSQEAIHSVPQRRFQIDKQHWHNTRSFSLASWAFFHFPKNNNPRGKKPRSTMKQRNLMMLVLGFGLYQASASGTIAFLSVTPTKKFSENKIARWKKPTTSTRSMTQKESIAPSTSSSSLSSRERKGALLSDLPTPCLVLELSLAENAVEKRHPTMTLDEFLANLDQHPSSEGNDNGEKDKTLKGSVFVHTQVTSTLERDATNAEFGSGKSLVIAEVDVSPHCIPGGAYLGIGLANHHVGGYYWARGMGIGASLPAHGIAFREGSGNPKMIGKLYWKKRGPGLDATETTEESSNSNDGKRSEWADFVAVGETVQLVPEQPTMVLQSSSSFKTLLGMRRIGRPLGADPIVEKIWTKGDGTNGWIAN